jgi:RNA ligase
MNYGQNQADLLLMDYAVEVTDKMDGSLGILFFHKIWDTATRGSFASEQAYEMQKILSDKYTGIELNPAWTYLFEIIYPGNRIVLDYGDTRDLYLLGARHIETGSIRAAKDVEEWYGPKTPTYPFATLSEALAAPPRANAEGYVVYFPDLDYRVKIKQEDYVLLHRIVTGLTARRIWENMKEGKNLFDLLEIVPDEWHEWLVGNYDSIGDIWSATMDLIEADYDKIIEILPKDFTRKQFAEVAKTSDYTGFMFMLLDNKDISDKVWDLVRPSAE